MKQLSTFREGAEDLVPPILPAAPPSYNEVLILKMKTNKSWTIYSNTKFDIEITFEVMKLLCSGNIKWASLQRRPTEVLRNSALNKNLSPKFGPGSRLGTKEQSSKFSDPNKEKGLAGQFSKQKKWNVSCLWQILTAPVHSVITSIDSFCQR